MGSHGGDQWSHFHVHVSIQSLNLLKKQESPLA